LWHFDCGVEWWRAVVVRVPQDVAVPAGSSPGTQGGLVGVWAPLPRPRWSTERERSSSGPRRGGVLLPSAA